MAGDTEIERLTTHLEWHLNSMHDNDNDMYDNKLKGAYSRSEFLWMHNHGYTGSWAVTLP